MFGLRIEVNGRLARDAPVLVLANHVSWLDISVIGSLGPLSFVAKSEVERWPVVGLFARLQRTVFIDRARRAHTAEVNATVARRLAGGDIIVLFPEGTSSDGNRVLPFRSSLVGAARAALSASGAGTIQLQPLAITYTRRNGLPLTRRDRPEIAWYGDMDLAPHLAALIRRRPVRGAGHLRGADPLRRRNRSQARHRQGRGGGAAGLSRGCRSGAARRAEPEGHGQARRSAGRRCAAVNDRRELRFSILLSGRTA